jgi:hypothetical protein
LERHLPSQHTPLEVSGQGTRKYVALVKILDQVRSSAPAENCVILLVSDEFPQFENPQAKDRFEQYEHTLLDPGRTAFKPYTARLPSGVERSFYIHVYANRFPDARRLEDRLQTVADQQVLEGAGDRVLIPAPPTVTQVRVLPSQPRAGAPLRVAYDFKDPNGDLEKGSDIRWYRNGALQAAYNGQRAVPRWVTGKQEQWYVTVRPKDGRKFGPSGQSRAVIIQPRPFPWWLVLLVLAAFLLGGIKTAWRGYYNVKINGGAEQKVRVWGGRRRVSYPGRDQEAVGYLRPIGLGMYGCHRLALCLRKGYRVREVDGREASAPGRSTRLALNAGSESYRMNKLKIQPPQGLDECEVQIAVQRGHRPQRRRRGRGRNREVEPPSTFPG